MKYPEISYIELPAVASTNSYVESHIDDLPGSFVVVSTINQTDGKGQEGNKWESEAGKNITFSLLCHPQQVDASEQYIISMMIAVAVMRVLRARLPQMSGRFRVKWPNDVYFDDKKLGGILIETRLKGKRISHCIVGIGLNINQTRFLSDAPNPVSLKQITQKEEPAMELMQDVCESFVSLLQSADYATVRREYHEMLYRRDGEWLFEDAEGRFSASIERVENNGRLVLRKQGGECKEYWLKEVKFII